MKIHVVICPKEHLGPLTAVEAASYRVVDLWFYKHSLTAPKDMLNTSVRGWNCVQHWETCRILACDVLRGRLDRFQPVAYPWVPPGELWSDDIGTNIYMTSWRIDFRPMRPLETV